MTYFQTKQQKKLISLSIRSTSTYVSCLAGYGFHSSNALFAEKFYGVLK